MTLWYNPNINKLLTTIDLGNSYLISYDSYRFNGKSYHMKWLFDNGYVKIGDL